MDPFGPILRASGGLDLYPVQLPEDIQPQRGYIGLCRRLYHCSAGLETSVYRWRDSIHRWRPDIHPSGEDLASIPRGFCSRRIHSERILLRNRSRSVPRPEILEMHSIRGYRKSIILDMGTEAILDTRPNGLIGLFWTQ